MCVPIDTRKLEDFDPLGVPTVQGLLEEIDTWKADAGEDGSDDKVKNLQDWEKTSLRPYVEYFRSFVLALMKDERDPKIKREREESEAMEF